MSKIVTTCYNTYRFFFQFVNYFNAIWLRTPEQNSIIEMADHKRVVNCPLYINWYDVFK